MIKTLLLISYFICSSNLFADCTFVQQNKIKNMNLKDGTIKFIKSNNECRYSINWYGRFEINYILDDAGMGLHSIADGPQIQWYEDNGQKKSEFTNVRGKINGLNITWHKNGVKKSEAMYKDNVINGIETTWDENGTKISEIKYKNGLIDNGNVSEASENASPTQIKADKKNIQKESTKKQNTSNENKDKEIQEMDASIKDAKNKCIALGFEQNTTKFGKCVLELTK